MPFHAQIMPTDKPILSEVQMFLDLASEAVQQNCAKSRADNNQKRHEGIRTRISRNFRRDIFVRSDRIRLFRNGRCYDVTRENSRSSL